MSLVCLLLRAYQVVLFARVILSFVFLARPDFSPPEWLRPILDLIYGLTDPVLDRIRRVIPQPAGLPIDLSFIVLYLLLQVVMRFVCF